MDLKYVQAEKGIISRGCGTLCKASELVGVFSVVGFDSDIA